MARELLPVEDRSTQELDHDLSEPMSRDEDQAGAPLTRSAPPGTAAGVNFALFSENATKVELCLFDSPDATKESSRIAMPEQTDLVWHAYLPDVRPGQLYGYRVHGPYEPGQRPPLQPEQGAARPLRQGDRPRRPLGRLAVRLQARRPGRTTSPSTTATAPRSPRWPG